jgi:hypothetical protein
MSGLARRVSIERHCVTLARQVIHQYLSGTLTLHVHVDAPPGADGDSRAPVCALVWPRIFQRPTGFDVPAPTGFATVEIVHLVDGGRPLAVAAIPSVVALERRVPCRRLRPGAAALCLVSPDFAPSSRSVSFSGHVILRSDGSATLDPRRRPLWGACLRITVDSTIG